jgi:hypothetical protein
MVHYLLAPPAAPQMSADESCLEPRILGVELPKAKLI